MVWAMTYESFALPSDFGVLAFFYKTCHFSRLPVSKQQSIAEKSHSAYRFHICLLLLSTLTNLWHLAVAPKRKLYQKKTWSNHTDVSCFCGAHTIFWTINHKSGRITCQRLQKRLPLSKKRHNATSHEPPPPGSEAPRSAAEAEPLLAAGTWQRQRPLALLKKRKAEKKSKA